jgi:predicted  nucleic acid-binding Zn-ribbon protein
MRFEDYIFVILFVIVIGIILSGCQQTKSAVIVDTGDIERLRQEYRQLMGEYSKLQSDYQRLAERSQYYAEYYQHATERIADGTRKLAEVNASGADEVTKLRKNLAIVRTIIHGLVNSESAEGSKDITTDGD